jgi:hypothetical protein
VTPNADGNQAEASRLNLDVDSRQLENSPHRVSHPRSSGL